MLKQATAGRAVAVPGGPRQKKGQAGRVWEGRHRTDERQRGRQAGSRQAKKWKAAKAGQWERIARCGGGAT